MCRHHVMDWQTDRWTLWSIWPCFTASCRTQPVNVGVCLFQSCEPKRKKGSSTIYGQKVTVKGLRFRDTVIPRGSISNLVEVGLELFSWLFGEACDSECLFFLLTEQPSPFLVFGIIFCTVTGIRDSITKSDFVALPSRIFLEMSASAN